MKFRNLLQLVIILLAGQFMFSCNSAKYYEFAASNQGAYKVAKEKPAQDQVAEEQISVSAVALAASEKEAATKETAPILEASTERKAVAVVRAPKTVSEIIAEEVSAPVMTITEAEALAIAKERVKNMTKAEKKELKSDMREVMRQRGSSVNIVEIILAVLLPPLAVFLHDGLGTTFWISLLLTLLFWIPGVIYALLIVTDTI